MPDKETGALTANGWRDTLRRVKRGWNDKPLMSISLVLVLLVAGAGWGLEFAGQVVGSARPHRHAAR